MSVENNITRKTVVGLRTPTQDPFYLNYVPHISRGLYDRKYFSQSEAKEKEVIGYDGLLPRYNEMSAAEYIQKSLRRIRPIRILDIGCGRGEFLLDAKAEWGRRVQPVGISLHDITSKSFLDQAARDELLEHPTERELKNAKVPLVIGDAHRLSSVLKREKVSPGFDIAVSAFTFLHLSDPLAALKEVYKVLKMGGVGFIHHELHVNLRAGEEDALKDYLQVQYGFQFSDSGNGGNGVAFKKEYSRLHIPVRYVVHPSGSLGYELK